MKVGVAQILGIPGDIAGNLSKISGMAAQGARQKCRLILFPELVDLGYDFPAILAHGPTAWSVVEPALAAVARDLGVCLVCGVCQPGAAGLANALVAWDATGDIVASYHKSHLFRTAGVDESRIFHPGGQLAYFDLDGFRFGLSICYDLRFPELFRALTWRGCQALLMAAAWPATRIGHWTTLAAARAIENQAYFLGANQIGSLGAFPCGGSSLCCDPWGQSITADDHSETLLVAELNMSALASARSSIPALRQRRTDLY